MADITSSPLLYGNFSIMKKLSLVQKIGGGFGLVLALMFVVSLLSWNGLNRVSGGLNTYNQYVDNANLIFRLQADMLNMQMNVKDFIITGDEQAIERYNGYLTRVEKTVETVTQQTSDRARKEELQTISAKIDAFKSAFQQIVTLKNRRNQLFDEKMAVIGPRIAADLAAIMDRAHNDQDEVATYLAGMALRNLLMGRIYIYNYLDSIDTSFIEKVEKEFVQFDDFAQKMTILLQDEDGRQTAAQTREAAVGYLLSFQELVTTVQKRDQVAAQALEETGPSIVASLSALTASVQKQQKSLGKELQSRADGSKMLVLAIALAALIIGGLLAWLLTRIITRPILKTASFADIMAQGDFSGSLDIDQQDEIGRMSRSLNDMIAKLGGMLKDIIEGIATLSVSSTELKEIATEMSKGSEETAQKSTTVAAAAEEMSINMNSVAATMEQASSNIGLVASATEEMTATVTRISEGAGRAKHISTQAVAQSSQTFEKMEALGEAASKIGRITETITEISEQTNLLALNATIEAARAGEAGKGFAVVANEIKELARQTAGATVDIKTQIESVQDTTSSSIEDIRIITTIIDEINEVINTIATSVEEQTSVTDEITANINQSSQGISEVNTNVAQSSVVVNDISKDISEVNEAASAMTTRSSRVEGSADKLLSLSRQLEDMVSRFKV